MANISSFDTLLFVGEGNFSFSAGLANAFQNGQLIATDWIPDLAMDLQQDKVISECGISRAEHLKLNELQKNVKFLKDTGHHVFFDVDATKLEQHSGISKLLNALSSSPEKAMKIGIVFNFPHAKSKKMKIDLNRDLLRDFFQSCDNLHHSLGLDVTPMISLCAGQSGIPEVDSVSRAWGDSWQVNDMAAHGNYVCVDISKFNEWWLSRKMISEGGDYQSSYYRLQTGVSFTTEGALTLTFEHRTHVDPEVTGRLKLDILRMTSAQSKGNPIIYDLVRNIGSIKKEGVMLSEKFEIPYHHWVDCPEACLKSLETYLKKPVTVSADKVQIVMQPDKAAIIGTWDSSNGIVRLFLDQLIEFKHNDTYRYLMSATSNTKRSLYPKSHKFHISYWVNSSIDDNIGKTEDTWTKADKCRDRENFLHVLLEVFGLMLKTFQLVEEYHDEKTERRSLCWEVEVQALVGALSRLKAHQMYLLLRKELETRLEVAVR